jgi:hypothetical protein
VDRSVPLPLVGLAGLPGSARRGSGSLAFSAPSLTFSVAGWPPRSSRGGNRGTEVPLGSARVAFASPSETTVSCRAPQGPPLVGFVGPLHRLTLGVHSRTASAALRSSAASRGSRSVLAVRPPRRLAPPVAPRARARDRSWGSRRFGRRRLELRARAARRRPRRAMPSGAFPSPAAAPRHRGRCPPAVTLTGRLQGLAPQTSPLPWVGE